MDKASDYESGDSRFESWQGRILSICFSSIFFFYFPYSYVDYILTRILTQVCLKFEKNEINKITYRRGLFIKPIPQ